jgi:DNA-binding NarL/FixJ family response regulator
MASTLQQRALQLSPREKTVPKVVVVGRHALSSSLIADALTHNLGLDASVVSPPELLRSLGRSEFALAIISADLNSVSGAGFELADTISRSYPKIPIIIMVDELSYDSVTQAFRSGARGVFEHGETMAKFLDCVEHVRQGLIWAGKEGTDFLMESLRKIPAPSGITGDDFSALTVRELQVVQYAARGKTNKAIACELYLSEHTVKNYLFRAFDKLHVSNRVELLFYLTTRGQALGPLEIDLKQPSLDS